MLQCGALEMVLIESGKHDGFGSQYAGRRLQRLLQRLSNGSITALFRLSNGSLTAL
jgi:hypothetical protein